MRKIDPFEFTESYNYVERCPHGVPLDYGECEQCRYERHQALEEDLHEQWWAYHEDGLEKAPINPTRYPEW